MSTENQEGWEAATFEGSRRAQLRRSLRLSVRQRLQNIEILVETSRRLADLGERPSRGTTPETGD